MGNMMVLAENAGGGVGMTISSVLEGVSDVLNAVVTTCTGNPVTMAIIGMSVVGVGVGLFRRFLHVGQ